MLLTAELLFYFQRCNRRAFLEVYGDRTQQDPQSDYLGKLLQDSAAHQNRVLADYDYQSPLYSPSHWQAGAEATREMMRQGASCIHRGVLLVPTQASSSISLLGVPDLLIKQPGESEFGDWHYVPTIIRLGKRPKFDYQIIAAFHAFLLLSIQGTMPQAAGLELRDRRFYSVNLHKVLPQLEARLHACLEMLDARLEPEVFISRQRCNLCNWLSSCKQVAQSQNHLSLIAGVTPTRYQSLQALGVTTVELLAQSHPQYLEGEIEPEVAAQLVVQAQAVLQNQAIAKSQPLPNDLPVSEVELYFDIEAEPELNLDYLLGVLVVDRRSQTQVFHPFLAPHPDAESQIWQQFLELVESYPDAPIFHFCDYEVKATRQLAKRYSTPRQRWEPLLKRFVDIHERVTRLAILPVEGYALKAIARWMGFEWQDSSANGAQCIYWYDCWLKTGNSQYLEAIVRYNQDDCLATHRVKEWLVQYFLPTHFSRGDRLTP
ncbi:MAG: TM0106 family RecB-like putative nuclease [Desertifilum sp. SIO1I2]|nr:TM0106 family RecB-like putative nuclease [Desertifilum sp. SIO1I2]